MKKTPRYHFTLVCHKWQSYDVTLLKYGAKQKNFLSFSAIFLPFYPSNDPKNQNVLNKVKKPEFYRLDNIFNESNTYMTTYCNHV